MIDTSNPKALEDHLANIKERLIQFSMAPRFTAERLKEVNVPPESKADEMDQTSYIIAHDIFVNRHKLRSTNRRVLDHFIDEDPHLTQSDRDNLDGFRDWHMGFLEVLERRPHTLLVRNWINGWHGEIRANVGIDVISKATKVGNVIVSGVTFFGDTAWLSGSQKVHPASDHKALLDITIKHCMSNPESLIRGNKERVQKGFEMQAERHQSFVDYFGDDCLCASPPEIEDKLHAFELHHITNFRGPDGLTAPERLKSLGIEKMPPVPRFELPDDLYSAEQMLIISDPLVGLLMDNNLPIIWNAFENKSLKAIRKHGKYFRRCITNSDAPPLPIRHMASRHPELFEAAIKEVFSYSRFDVSIDLEPMLFKYKGMATEPPREPSTVAVDLNDPVMKAIHG